MRLVDQRPSGWLKAVFRAPVLLYRVGLGGVLGRRFVYVVHTGRRSGRRRRTVLELVGYDDTIPEAFVVAAWGERSDWYRNITASRAVEIRVGRRRWRRPGHRVLDAAETVRLLASYRTSYPYAWKVLARAMGLPANPDHPAFREATTGIRALAFTPQRAAP